MNPVTLVAHPCPEGNDQQHTSLCFVEPILNKESDRLRESEKQALVPNRNEMRDEGPAELSQIALGLISNKESV